MNTKEENYKYVINRFAWIDNYTIKIISQDGIERLLDVNNNFQEIAYNVIPMYDKNLCKKQNIILESPEFKPEETLKRLIYKY